MSDNPFNAPQQPAYAPQNPQYAPTPQRPTMLTVILVLAMVISSFGFVCNSIGTGSLFFQDWLLSVNDSALPPTEDMLSARKEIIEMNQQILIPNLIILGSNVLISFLLFLASILCLNRKSAGRSLLSMAILFAALNVIARTVFQLYYQLSNGAKMADLQVRHTGQSAEGMEGLMEWSQKIGVGFVIGWALLLLGYYVFSWLYLQKDQVKAYFIR